MVDLNGGAAGEDFADTFTEGGAPVGIAAPTATVTDQDDTTLPLLKLDFDESTIVDAGAEFLTIGGTDFQLDAATNSTTAVIVGGISYDVTFTAATASFEIVRSNGAEMTIAQIEAILQDTTYRNDSALPTVGDRVLDVCVNDGDLDSNIATTTISVVRDAETAAWSITGPATVIDGNNATFVIELSDPLRDGETAAVDLLLDGYRYQCGGSGHAERGSNCCGCCLCRSGNVDFRRDDIGIHQRWNGRDGSAVDRVANHA